MSKPQIKIDIVSDFNCPWCYLGEARLRKAVRESADKFDFEIHHKPFELSPDAPQDGEKKEEYFIRNYGKDALARLNDSNQRLTEMGKQEGLEYDFNKSSTVHNTFNAHRLTWLAGKYNVQQQVAQAVFKAHFTNGENINDPDVLYRIGSDNGIPKQVLEGFFSGDEGHQEIEELERWAYSSGINGVPTFVFNDKYSASGAQPSEVFQQIFDEVTSESMATEEKK